MAANYDQVGVKVGDTADYKESVSALGFNETFVLVWKIIGPTVWLNETFITPNGLLFDYQYDGNLSSFSEFLVAGNLSIGDHLWNDASAPTINKTITMNAGGASRLVNIVNNATLSPLAFYNLYYDKQTGLLVQGDFQSIGEWANWTLLSTTAWSEPAQSEGITLTTVALIGCLGTVALIVVAVEGEHLRRKQ
jgi:hypothetical protein